MEIPKLTFSPDKRRPKEENLSHLLKRLAAPANFWGARVSFPQSYIPSARRPADRHKLGGLFWLHPHWHSARWAFYFEGGELFFQPYVYNAGRKPYPDFEPPSFSAPFEGTVSFTIERRGKWVDFFLESTCVYSERMDDLFIPIGGRLGPYVGDKRYPINQRYTLNMWEHTADWDNFFRD